ncbi:MAG: hypothetical protein AzoDbin1_04129 [Azoarcus sp.]|nr:hypothetical protein [Azoarcus sp.]
MANKAFSQLPAAGALTGAEIVALTQSAASVRATLADIKTHFGVGGKVFANIGDGAATTFNVAHGLNTRNVHVTVYRNVTPWDTVVCDVARPDANTVTISGFGIAPSLNLFTVVIQS